MHIFGGPVEAVDGKEGLGEKALLIFSQVTISLSHDYTKAFVWITTNWKILREMGIPDHLTCLLKNLYAGQEPTELDMEQQTISKFGKEYIKAVYCHPDYLTYMQSKSCEMLGWMKLKLESRLPGEISITSDMQIAPLLWQKAKRN